MTTQTASISAIDPEPARYRQQRIEHWNAVANQSDRKPGWGPYYHGRIEQILAHLVPPNQRVLELGCGRGSLLASLKPSRGVGVDFSQEMIQRASRDHPNLHFILADVHELELNESFDFIILSDLLNDLWDVLAVLQRLTRFCTPQTRIVFNIFSQLWQIPLDFAQRLGLKQPTLPQNWLAIEDIQNMLELSNLEMVHRSQEILWPVYTPIIDTFFNRFLVRFWPFNQGALTHVIVARAALTAPLEPEPVVSVIVPARNESGNIQAIFSRVPEMGGGTELLFVEGHSTDDTYQAIESAIAANPQRRAKLFRQTGKGKGDAVRLGFAEASGDVLMILDADLTVPPEELPRFYDAIRAGKGEFLNGVRLVYPMEQEAMQTLNLIANKIFGLLFTWLLGQSLRDTLCGTKVLRKSDYLRIVANRSYFGDFDPFGDFDLLFGAAKLNLKMLELPIRYRRRTYGSTNIQRFHHGWLLLRMVQFAARRIKFV